MSEPERVTVNSRCIKDVSIKRDVRDVKELRTVLKKILSRETVLRYHFLESLILAQDERWRRA